MPCYSLNRPTRHIFTQYSFYYRVLIKNRFPIRSYISRSSRAQIGNAIAGTTMRRFAETRRSFQLRHSWPTTQLEAGMTAVETRELFSLNLMNTNLDPRRRRRFWKATRPKTAAFVNAHCINETARSADYRWALEQGRSRSPRRVGHRACRTSARFPHGRQSEWHRSFCPALPARRQSNGRLDLPARQPRGCRRSCRRPGLRARTRTWKSPAPAMATSTDDESADVIDEINRSGADIVLVALGVPRQDVWIARNRHRIAARLVMGVGAQFDFWSGRVPRAPSSFCAATGLEWTFRLAVEPKRMARRYLDRQSGLCLARSEGRDQASQGKA